MSAQKEGTDMNFVAARCPQCGGELQLDNEQVTGFCMHCGSKIVVQDAIRAVRIDNTHMIETWMKMGRSAAESNNYEEAYKYFTKVVEVDLENWNALFLKGQAAGFLSTLSNPRLDELIGGINAAIEIIENSEMPAEEVVKTKNLFAMSIFEIISGIDSLVFDRNFESFDKFMETDWELMCDTRSWHEKEIKYLQKAISLIDGYADETSLKNKSEIKQSIVTNCFWICNYEPFFLDFNKEQFRYFGYAAQQKKPFIDLADQLIIEIKTEVPNYWTTGEYINRLDTPETFDPHFDERAKAVEKQIEIIRRKKLEEYQKQKYWEGHPEEYRVFLAEEKMRNDKLEKQRNILRIEIAEKTTQVEEEKRKIGLEISDLLNERKKLGVFAVKQKKEIDEKINAKENDIEKFRNRLDNLNKDLQKLEE